MLIQKRPNMNSGRVTVTPGQVRVKVPGNATAEEFHFLIELAVNAAQQLPRDRSWRRVNKSNFFGTGNHSKKDLRKVVMS